MKASKTTNYQTHLSKFVVNVNSSRFHSLDEKGSQRLVSLGNGDMKKSERNKRKMTDWRHQMYQIYFSLFSNTEVR